MAKITNVCHKYVYLSQTAENFVNVMTLLSKALNENNRKRWPFGATENDVLNKKVCPHQEKPRKWGRQQLFLLSFQEADL